MGLNSEKFQMVHSHGLRAGTRDLFCRGYKENGPRAAKVYLTTYKAGDMVDIVCSSSVHKGMPYKYYHGRTGIVRNVTQRGLGVEVTKPLGNRVMKKRINVRVEHVRKSKCRDDFLKRVVESDAKKAEARKAGVKISTKRTPIMPKSGKVIKLKSKATLVEPRPYEIVM